MKRLYSSTNLRTTMDCGIIKNMKSFAPIVAFAGLLCCLFSCDTGKSGPFTFTNNTEETVNVLIDQDGIEEKTFTAGEKYTGKDYFTPQITFVKGFSSAGDKSIIDNRFIASSINGFDYSFTLAEGTAINIMVNLSADFTTKEPSLKDAYLAEAQGKLGEYSNTTLSLTSLSEQATTSQMGSETSATSSVSNYKLYTDTPNFRIYRDKTVDGKQQPEDITNLFTIALGKSEIPPMASETSSREQPAEGASPDSTTEIKPTVQWNLEITYPKVEVVQE